MKKETRKRIEAYKKALPHMKERVAAVVMLFIISLTMMTSATFAWITLSRAPEVSGLATTIATNGNLEIALSDTDGLIPDETAVGDGAKDITESNLTWGNLVNLDHESYGLQHITLRPSVLNTGSLEESPLYAVTYGADGRIEDIALDFAFTNYQPSQIAGGKGTFIAESGTKYGVRAISSVKATSSIAQADLFALTNAVNRNMAKSTMDFQGLYGNREYIEPITKLAGIYITYRIEDKDQDCSAYITPFYGMMEEFGAVLDQVGQTMLSVVNLQHYMYCDKLNSDDDPSNNVVYKAFTMEQLQSGTVTDSGTGAGRRITLTGNAVLEQLKKEGFQDAATDHTVTALKMYVNAQKKFQPAFAAVETYYNNYKTAGKKVGWEALRDHINVMANIYTTTIQGIPTQGITMDNIGSLTGSGTKECIVHSGLLVDLDQMLGTNLAVNGVEATVKVLFINANVVANVTTAAQNNAPYQLVEAANLAKDKASGGASSVSLTATDTYGMAIDFWVRTNAQNSMLTLEGELVTKTIVVGQDDDGKDITQTIVVGYKGANRVWEEDDPGLPVLGTSSTQGSGSCYVFYPESPEDQTQSLKLLEAMCIAFISEDGTLLAQADMDTANAFQDGGRVLVPMKLRAKTVVTGQTEKKDENGNIIYKTDENGDYILDAQGNRVPEMEDVLDNSYYITQLQQNEATRITAVVYMDGSRLTNSEVLAASAINGQLNVQFGTSEDITSMDEGDLKNQFYNITISADKKEFGAYDADNKPVVNLSLGINGMEVSSVKGNFVSYISATQGAKQPTFTFQKTDDGWKAAVTLNGAGKYQLRSLQINGVDYPLSQEQIEDLTITVAGTAVNSVECVNWNGNNQFTYKSADPYYNLDMLVTVSGTIPKKVQGVFAHEDGQNVTVNFTRTNEGWKAISHFTTSGTYKMTYMIIDDVYVPLAEAQYKTLTLQLGLNAQVFVESPVNTAYKTLEELSSAVAELPVASNGAQTAEAEEALTADQKTLANEVIDSATWTEEGATHLTAEEKTALKAAVATETFANADQKTLMQKAIAAVQEDLLEELYSDADNCLNLQLTAEGYSMLFAGGDPLFMDVSCIITDDKGNMMEGFTDVDLYYGIGTSQLNRLTAMNMVYNSSAGRYEGQFRMERPGLYAFQQVVVDDDIIDRASSAPMIRAVSPNPVEYVGKAADYQSYVEAVGSTNRYMDVVLKESASAAVALELTHTDTGVAPTKYLFTYDGNWPADRDEEDGYAAVYKLDSFENTDGEFVYRANVPTDGTWKVTGMMLSSVFYKAPGATEGTFYDGVVGEGGTGWLNFTDKVVKSNIETTFFTTVNFSVTAAENNTLPNIDGYRNTFMADNTVTDMTLSLTDYRGNALPDVKVKLKYTWDRDPINDEFTVVSGTNYPNTTFGADSLASADGGKTFVVKNADGTNVLNFQMPGTYKADFELSFKTPSGKTMSYTKDNISELGAFAVGDVKVQWILPDVKITDFTPRGEVTTGNARNEKRTGSKSADGYECTVYSDCGWVNTYIGGYRKNSITLPNVTLTLDEAGSCTTATFTVPAAGTGEDDAMARNYVFTSTELVKSSEIGEKYEYDFRLFKLYGSRLQGSHTIYSIVMRYGNIDYTVKLKHHVTINNPG